VIAGLMFGGRMPMQWGEPRVQVDFYDLKGAIERVLESVGIREASFSPVEIPTLHPRSSCEVSAEGKRLGLLGELHPMLARQLDVPRGVLLFELDLQALVGAAKLLPSSRGVPKYPAVLRDLAVVLDEKVAAADVEKEIRAAGAGLVEDAILFDIFRGKTIPEGKKSLAYAIRYRASDRTLTDEEINKAHGEVVAMLSKRLGAELRA
jgi:phenylalanyl-tRNA synthetase beta chain